ncbi:HD domain-containing protein [Pseudoxanthomonas dokdonensis]|uniref:N-methyl-D-aspartate receptor NMDAR2C subunit n=1 Tax=Pseudoxanthomonas dokdonensis TaxID=344882 RepID=A0A0R0D1T6_9GAMM|nr:hypothetical protein [Pseudoxanthomonas dokdonensis]KRG72033.1 N-methyl-D-aspartate receptor NMDAR2C subunit [Pseudoxanthomonas dokdonensis]
MIGRADSWQRAWRGIGADGDGDEVLAGLLAAYAQPHRHYHTLQHLDECLQGFEQGRVLALHPHEVELALWFHDAVYEVKAADNEQRSADWAAQALQQANVADACIARVHALIMATCHRALPVSADAQLLVDIDLSILGAAPARFAEYERQIRQEYAYVPGFLFKRKRGEILRGFLDRPRIYSTALFHDRLEAAARANLAGAVA